MQYRQLGRTGLKVSALGFGCGAVGGLLTRGEYRDMVWVVARAIESGITYFDTARAYGDGKSETNLGLTLKELGADVLIGSKVNLGAEEMDDIERAITSSAESSLKRLRRDSIDLIQLHNPVTLHRQPERGWVNVEDVEVALRAFEKLRDQGKARYYGINGLGDTAAIHQAIGVRRADAFRGVDTVQSCFNLINPTAGYPAPKGFPFQDYGKLIDKAAARQMGVIAIRVLAAGALGGSLDRVPNAAPEVTPIGTSATYVEDIAMAQRFRFLVEDGYVGSLVEAAIRFAIGHEGVSTALVGISNIEQLEQAIAFANRGPLPIEALNRLPAVWSTYTTGTQGGM